MNYEIRLTTGESFTLINVDNFNADAVANSLNSPELFFVNFGGRVLHKRLVEDIVPIKVQEEVAE